MFLPAQNRPKPVSKAAKTLADRERDHAAVESELRSARAGLEEAKALDRAAYATSRDASKDDPGPVHLTAAREHLLDVERRLSGETLRRDNARGALSEALTQHAEEWSDAITAELIRAEQLSLAAVQSAQGIERERDALRGVESWLATFQRTGKPAAKSGSPSVRSTTARNPSSHTGMGFGSNPRPMDCYAVDELLAIVLSAIADSTVGRKAEAETERLEREAEGERQRKRIATAREGVGR
jgi:hypothetical protein